MNKKRLNDCYKCLSNLFEYGSSNEKEAIVTIKNMISEELKENLTKHNSSFIQDCYDMTCRFHKKFKNNKCPFDICPDRLSSPK